MLKKIIRKPYHILRIILKVNWYKTVRVNFSLLPFNQAISFPIIVIGKLIIDSLKGKVIFDCPISFGIVTIGKDFDNMPIAINPSRLYIGGELYFKGKCSINHSTNLVVWTGGRMEIGRYVRTLSGVLLKSTYYVKIGDYTRLTSGSFIMDSNIHAIKDIETGTVNRICRPIVIGNCCWIGMNSSILGGAIIPDYSISTRYTFINKDYSNEGIGLLLAGSPAKIIKRNVQRLYNMNDELKISEFFRKNPGLEVFYSEVGLEQIDESQMDLEFKI